MRFATSKACITPQVPTHLGGYSARRTHHVGVCRDIYAKALLLDDDQCRILFISLEITGADRLFVNEVKAELSELTGIARGNIFIHSVHSHSSPAAYIMRRFPYTSDDAYLALLKEAMCRCAKDCVRSLVEGRMQVGSGETYIAMNRRRKTPDGVKLMPNPEGFVDRDLAVLTVANEDGDVRAVLYSCACHPTVLGPDNMFVVADFVSYASAEIERMYPGSMAVFVQGACADNNPWTKAGGDDYRQTYFSDCAFTGKVLANDVQNAILCGMEDIHPAFRVTVADLPLHFGPYKTEEFRRLAGANVSPKVKGYAEWMLGRIEAGEFGDSAAFELGVIELSSDVRLVTMEGEVCQEIGVHIKEALPGRTITAGYTNGVLAYIPTDTVLEEGGYEATAPYLGYCLPGAFAPGVEKRIIGHLEGLFGEKERRA